MRAVGKRRARIPGRNQWPGGSAMGRRAPQLSGGSRRSASSGGRSRDVCRIRRTLRRVGGFGVDQQVAIARERPKAVARRGKAWPTGAERGISTDQPGCLPHGIVQTIGGIGIVRGDTRSARASSRRAWLARIAGIVTPWRAAPRQSAPPSRHAPCQSCASLRGRFPLRPPRARPRIRREPPPGAAAG